MEYNLAGIRKQVIEDKLDDPSFDAETVDRFINTVQRRIFNQYELPFQEKVFSGVLPAEQRIFVFPPDVQIVQRVVVTAPDGQQQDITGLRMKYQDFVKSYPTPANNPESHITAWMSYAGKIYTSAPTDVAYQMDTFYLQKPVTLVQDSDVPQIPEEFSELLVLGAFKLVLERNEDYDLAAVVGNQYNDILDQLVSRYGFRLTGAPMTIGQPRVRAGRRR